MVGAADDLRYGSVIEFEYATTRYTAMVLMSKGDRRVLTDEETSTDFSDGKIVVLGLTGEASGQYHPPGGTATFDTRTEQFEVIEP